MPIHKKPAGKPAGLSLRLLAADRLRDVLSGSSFTPISTNELSDSRDRALANRLVTTALRRHGHLTLVIGHLLERGMPKKSGSFEAILRLSLAQLLYLPDLGDHSALFLAGEAIKRDTKTQHLGGLMNAALRRAQAEAVELREAPLPLLFPDWLQKSWGKSYGLEALSAFGQALLDGAPLDLTLKADYPALPELLNGSMLFADTLRIKERDTPVEQMAGYAEGRWWVQDAAAAIAARLMNLVGGARVLDLCAAPGGKTAQLVKAGYKVVALDSDAARLQRLRQNLSRLAYQADIITADASGYDGAQAFDGVLLDAPCSATGTLRRHPEMVWHRSAGDLKGRVALQRRLITSAARALKPGGTFIYCVCSLEPEEGEHQAAWALSANLGLEPKPIGPSELAFLPEALTKQGQVRTHPGIKVPGGGTLDGFFVARFRHI